MPQPYYRQVYNVSRIQVSLWKTTTQVPGLRRIRTPAKSAEHRPQDEQSSKSDPKISLLEELFPEETRIHRAKSDKIKNAAEDVPRLPLPGFGFLDPLGGTDPVKSQAEIESARSASAHAFRQWNLTVLVVRRVSKSLTESDFRRIVPKGHHIDEWQGLGNFIQVIPARDQTTLQQSGYYFLLFPNPAYARAYQSRVRSLHRMARAYTSASIEWPVLPPSSVDSDALQIYALFAPSQRVSLKTLLPPYKSQMNRLLEQRGYPQLVYKDGTMKKAVLFWIDGYQPSLYALQHAISRDGRARGLAWALAEVESPIEKVLEYVEDSQSPDSASPRWLISFQDENEARRFVRLWHHRPFPLKYQHMGWADPPLMSVEFVW